MITVVIPTCNRNESLKNCVETILKNSLKPERIIIIDSSDGNQKKSLNFLSKTIQHEFTSIKSAAIQRNLGKEKVDSSCEYLAFLDDDVLIPNDYFSQLIFGMEETNSIGISGVALNFQKVSNTNSKRVKSLIQKCFFLDSEKSGTILKSGVNTSIKNKSNYLIEVEWLIGCSIWKYNKINKIEFEKDFFGQSLGEDVIFSLKASRLGKLTVDKRVVINHLESPTMRPKPDEFIYMWIINRKRIIQELKPNPLNNIAFHWANFGKLMQICFLPFPNRILTMQGFLKAYKKMIFGENEN
jgi:GT2 family glycosyltransferase